MHRKKINNSMKHILILCCLLSLTACKNDQKIDYALLAGKVENTSSDKVVIKSSNFNQEIPIQSDGTFADTLKLQEAGFYTLSIGRERTSVYLKNGDNLNLSLDVSQFDETLKYVGEGAYANNYLTAKQLNVENQTSDSKALYSLEEVAFKSRIDSLYQSNLSLLDKISEGDDNFNTIEAKNLVYDNYSYFNNYESYHGRFANLADFKVSEDFLPEGLKNLSFEDADSYKMSSSYKNMVFNKTLNDLFETIGDDYLNTSTEELKGIESIKIPALKDDVVDYLGGFLVSPGNPYMQSVYEFFLANTTKDETKTKLNEVFEKGKDLIKGSPSPQFTNYENHKGGTLSLGELKGKYVYIDVWATWCGPCKREIPSLKEVEKQYHGKNIEFISTSIDVAEDHDTWLNMVNDMSLGGTQLFADNDWNSQFVKDYGIEGIPRFILVDPEGNIVNADAPRPSNPRLVELFNSLNI